jgi:aminopeptidase N
MTMRRGRAAGFIVGLGLALVGATQGHAEPAQLVYYAIDATLGPAATRVEVTATAALRQVAAGSRLAFLLSSQAKLESVRARTAGGWLDVPFEAAGQDSLILHVPAALGEGDTLTAEFKYLFPVALPDSGVLILDRGHRWYPLLPDQVAVLELACTVPPGYTALSAGNLVQVREEIERTRFVWRSTLPVFKVPLLVFRTRSYLGAIAPAADQDVCLYRPAGDSLGTGAILAEAGRALAFYGGLLGTYPYARLTMVAVPDFEGINVASGLLMIGTGFMGELTHGRFNSLDLTIAEQWFGAGVFGKYGEPGFWIVALTLPHYLRMMYVAAIRGQAAFEEELGAARDSYRPVAGGAADVSLLAVDAPNTREQGVVLYAKGPLALHRVHRALGDERWKACLREVYRAERGRALSYAGLRAYLAKYDERDTVVPLWDKLMTEKGLPAE